MCVCVYVFMCLKEGNISIVVICYNGIIIEYDRSKSGLSKAALHTTQDANSIEKFKVRLTPHESTRFLLFSHEQIV